MSVKTRSLPVRRPEIVRCPFPDWLHAAAALHHDLVSDFYGLGRPNGSCLAVCMRSPARRRAAAMDDCHRNPHPGIARARLCGGKVIIPVFGFDAYLGQGSALVVSGGGSGL